MHEQFPGSTGNAEGNSSDGKKLFMLIFSWSTGAGMRSQTLFLKSNRLWVCYWIFSTQCCQVLRRLLRQFNKNILLFSEITPLNYIFKNSTTFHCLCRWCEGWLLQHYLSWYILHAICVKLRENCPCSWNISCIDIYTFCETLHDWRSGNVSCTIGNFTWTVPVLPTGKHFP
jgi:hypothetical protein